MKGINLLTIIEEMRKMDSRMECQSISTFLCVAIYAKKSGVTMKFVGDTIGIAQSSVSRNAWKLGKQGLNLLTCEECPDERRRKILNLSHKGKKVFETLTSLVKN